MKKMMAALLAGAMLMMATSAMATQINNAPLSVLFTAGDGNSNLHFAVDNNNGVEVGLKAKLRYAGDVIPVGNVYNVPTGYQTSPTTYANWNFDFSLNLLATGLYNVVLSYDVDPSAGQNYKQLAFPMPGPNGYQNSWNYGMDFLQTGFNANQNATYDIDLSVYSLNSDLLADSHIQVVVGDGAAPVPEPGTMMLLGIGMAGLAIFGKRRMNKEA